MASYFIKFKFISHDIFCVFLVFNFIFNVSFYFQAKNKYLMLKVLKELSGKSAGFPEFEEEDFNPFRRSTQVELRLKFKKINITSLILFDLHN